MEERPGKAMRKGGERVYRKKVVASTQTSKKKAGKGQKKPEKA